MKKIIIGFIVGFLILVNCTGVFAARFESLGMNIDLPEEYYNLKAGIDTNDSKIEFYTTMMQTTKEDLTSEYRQNSTLYNGINSDLSKEIYIYETQNKLTKNVFHLSLATEEQLGEVEDELKKLSKAQGMSTTTQEIYKLGGITFVHLIAKKASLTIFQYYTIVNGVGITISLNSSDVTTQNEELKTIVDSISFDELQEKPAEYTNYILIGITAVLVIMVLVLMLMAFSSKNENDYEYEETSDNDEN